MTEETTTAPEAAADVVPLFTQCSSCTTSVLTHMVGHHDDFATALFQFAYATGQFCVRNICRAVNMPTLKLSRGSNINQNSLIGIH